MAHKIIVGFEPHPGLLDAIQSALPGQQTEIVTATDDEALAQALPGADILFGLGLNADAVRAYITNDKPTYPQFEAWIKEQDGATLHADSIGTLNDSIVGFNHDDETRQGILSANGLPDGDPQDAVNLNNLDDWLEFHSAEIA